MNWQDWQKTAPGPNLDTKVNRKSCCDEPVDLFAVNGMYNV